MRYTLAAVAFCVSVLPLSVASDQSATFANVANAVKAAVTASAANRQSFASYTCRYRVTKASAKSVEDALARRWVNAKACEIRYALDGPYEVQESFGPPASELVSKGNGGSWVGGYKYINADFTRAGYLRNGNLEIGHYPELRTASLTSPDNPHRIRIGTLLDFGVMGERFENAPEKLLENPAVYAFEPIGIETVRGTEAVTAAFRGNATMPEDWKFSFDPARGYLVLKATFTNKMRKSKVTTPTREVFLLSARECSARRWYPERWVMVRYPDVPGRDLMTWEYDLLELDADRCPDRKTFTRELPAGTIVNDYAHPIKHFVTKKDEKVTVDDLGHIEQMIKDSPGIVGDIPDALRKDTSITPTDRHVWLRRAGMGAGFGLAVWGVYRLVRRCRAA